MADVLEVPTTPMRPELPPIWSGEGAFGEDHASRCRVFMDRAVFRIHTQKRIELERQWNRARLYDRAKQWLQPYRGYNSRLWYSWEPIKIPRNRANAFPMPVRNIFSPAMQVEVSRLVGVGKRPYVRIDDDDAEDGAVIAKQVLLDRNEKTGWDSDQRRGSLSCCLFGTWIEMSRWLQSAIKTVHGPVTDAVACEHKDCDFTLASREIPAEAISGPVFQGSNAAASVVDVEEGTSKLLASSCPQCAKAGKFGRLETFAPQPIQPPAGEKARPRAIKYPNDSLGRPMGKDRALGEDVTEPVSPYGFFPGNSGIGYETDEEMEECGIRTPRSIPWLKTHYPGRADEVKPGIPLQILQHYPSVQNNWGVTSKADGAWDNHQMEDIYICKPNVEYPRGRLIVMAGKWLLFDGELLREGTDIAWMEIRVAQWELRTGEIWGKPMAEDMFSVQDNINSGLSLGQNVLQKYVEPKILTHVGMELHLAGGVNSPANTDFWTVDGRAIPPELASQFPKFFGHQGNIQGVWQMMDRDLAYAKEATGAADPDTGNVEGAELNYSALLFAAQRSAQRRQPRIDGIRRLCRMIWTHRLRLAAAFYDEPRLIHYRDENDKWKVQQFRGLQMKDQTDVALEDEPVVDSGIAKRASIEQGRAMGTIRTSANGGSYSTDRKINRAIGAPEDLNEESNIQDDEAKREWEAFVDDGVEPCVDQQSDYHPIHVRSHMTVLLKDKRALALKADITKQGVPWPMVLNMVWEWERMWSELSTTMEAVRKAPTPEDLADKVILGTMDQATAMQTQNELQVLIPKLTKRIAGFPAALEKQIYDVWARLIIANYKAGGPPIVGADAAEAGQVVRDRLGDILIRRTVPDDQWRLASPLEKLVRFTAHGLAAWKLAGLGMGPVAAAPPGAPGTEGAGAAAPPPQAAAPAAPAVEAA